MAAYVKTKRELAKAIRAKETEIFICDKSLAEKVSKFKGANMPEATAAQQSPAAALAGIEIVYIVAIITLGVICLYALYKDYDVDADFNLRPGEDVNVKMKMRRNK